MIWVLASLCEATFAKAAKMRGGLPGLDLLQAVGVQRHRPSGRLGHRGGARAAEREGGE
jgi:hypothetical protein